MSLRTGRAWAVVGLAWAVSALVVWATVSTRPTADGPGGGSTPTPAPTAGFDTPRAPGPGEPPPTSGGPSVRITIKPY